MKNIVIIQESLIFGGVEKVLTNLVSNLDRNKIKVRIILVKRKNDLINEIPEDIEVYYLNKSDKKSVKEKLFKIKQKYPYFVQKIITLFFLVFSIPYYLLKVLQYRVKIRNIINQDDLVISMNMRNLFISLLLLGMKNTKIGWIHGNVNNDTGRFSKTGYPFFKYYNSIITICNDCRLDFNGKFQSLKNRTVMFYNSFSIQNIYKKSKEDFETDYKYIISMGRLDYEKGFDVLITAFSKLIKDGYKEQLVILGRGPEEIKLKKLVNELNINDYVLFPGFDINPYKWVRNSEMYILPSRGEGFGNVVIEALACEVPVVSSDCKSGPKEILEDGKYGLLFESENINDLYLKMKMMLDDSSLRNDFKEKSMERAYFFDNKSIIPKIEEYLINL